MISRLDRLFMLLDSSASTVTKKAAASQIGDIQQQHPGELQTLLTKVQPYLHNSNWDTRIAAGHAIESIIKNVPSWNPPGQPLAQDEMKPEVGQIRLVDFSIQKVMEKGMDLLACEGNQYEVDGKNLNKEEIRQQYLLINKKLGLSSFIQQEATFINDKDLIHKFVSPTPSDEWPLTTFCQRLMNDLFHPVWEVRHGAATALREVVKHHGKGAGKATRMTANQLEEANQIWLEDLTFRLICVLALDKLGDFISDQVVAPVRETCAQALGLTVGLLRPAPTLAAIQLLLQLLERPEWEARHGGLLGLKYCLAVCSVSILFLGLF
ncbi:BTAF1 [Cordylochernes scorpioides]|uniref:BTAF1 n=1 Tax=Cordylochernes scorpioides TaxID=51811 RepID=A0ABY6KVP1_9ARAC|nr:BTAF1 [Cordylochernes scorpioides]